MTDRKGAIRRSRPFLFPIRRLFRLSKSAGSGPSQRRYFAAVCDLIQLLITFSASGAMVSSIAEYSVGEPVLQC
jgi:hypothetical protein